MFRRGRLNRLFLSFTLASFVFVCGNIIGAADSGQTRQDASVLPYQDEAEKMAMYFAGELRAPPELTERISRELKLLRDTWQDSIPVVKTQFFLPWEPATWVYVHLDDTTLESVKAGENPAWDSLNRELGLDTAIYSPRWHHLQLKFGDKFHLYRLAEAYIGFPGVKHIRITPINSSVRIRPHFVRSEDSTVVRYFFQDDCAPDIYFTYYYFLIDVDSAHYLGRHAECLEDQNLEWAIRQFGWLIIEPHMMRYIHSLEANRPAWVDTARSLLREPKCGWGFSWTRDQ